MIIYKLCTGTPSDIINHLQNCSNDFIPPLHSTVDVSAYAQKLSKKATLFEAWVGNELVGLVALYMNQETHLAFITNVSVLKNMRGKGIAQELLLNSFKHTAQNRINCISLEVNERNESALVLYKNFGFELVDKNKEQLLLEKKISYE